MVYGYIYQYKNRLNNKIYIGKTRNDPRRRSGSAGIHYGRCPKFYSAIKEHGFAAFELVILWELQAESEAELDKNLFIIEKNEINSRMANISLYGYNMSSGGSGGTLKEETKQKIAKTLANRQVTWGDKIGESLRRWHQENPGRAYPLGRKLSQETKDKMSVARQGKTGYWAGKARPNAFAGRRDGAHIRWHVKKNIKKLDCTYCDLL